MKVNDYVRTTNGYIGKIFNINEYREPTLKYGILTNYIDMVDTHFIGEEDIAKSSPNIEDLIEVGDIIKYHQVQNNYVKTNILYKAINNERKLIELEYDITHNKKSIISILTKEQFERCEYKI
jgi:hypothetical protein